MNATTATRFTRVSGSEAARDVLDRVRHDPGFQGYVLLRAAFTVAPILFGLDKFANVMVEWPLYLAPWVDRLVPGDAPSFMWMVGAVEIVAGLVVAFHPRYGGYLVAAWLAGIIVNLLTYPGFYDVALRDFGLLLAALALARLSVGSEAGGRSRERCR
jgi:hypothetical protein